MERLVAGFLARRTSCLLGLSGTQADHVAMVRRLSAARIGLEAEAVESPWSLDGVGAQGGGQSPVGATGCVDPMTNAMVLWGFIEGIQEGVPRLTTLGGRTLRVLTWAYGAQAN